jgi:hypothetical protein
MFGVLAVVLCRDGIAILNFIGAFIARGDCQGFVRFRQ